jgi:hypothetical protein
MITIIVLVYAVFFIDMVRLYRTKKDAMFIFSTSRTFLFGASTVSDVDDNGEEYMVFQIAFACFILTLTYAK